MKQIFKYTLDIAANGSVHSIAMPFGAHILSAHEQHGKVQIWAMVDSRNVGLNEQRTIRLYGTGHMFVEVGIFVGTVLLHDGNLVLHVFEDGR